MGWLTVSDPIKSGSLARLMESPPPQVASDRSHAFTNPRFSVLSIVHVLMAFRKTPTFSFTSFFSPQEEQAIDRVHRIGFRHAKLEIYRLVSKDTIEEQMINLQDSKNKLVQLATGATEGTSEKHKVRRAEIQDLTMKLFEQSRSVKRPAREVEDRGSSATTGAKKNAEGSGDDRPPMKRMKRKKE